MLLTHKNWVKFDLNTKKISWENRAKIVKLNKSEL